MEFADFFKKYGIRFLASLAVGVAFFLVYYLVINKTIVGSCDGLFIAGMICFAAGTFSIITNLEFFDIFAYSFLKMASHIKIMVYTLFEKEIKNEMKHFVQMNGRYEYTKSKEEQRKDNRFVFLSYYASSILLLIPALIIFIYIKISIA